MITDLLNVRNELWNEVRHLPGVISVGVGAQNGKTALVLFVNATKVSLERLPTQFRGIPVMHESSGPAMAHGDWHGRKAI